jgi:hypothetical protein
MKNVLLRLGFLALAVLIVLPVVSSVNDLPSNQTLLRTSGSPLPGPQPPPPASLA